jgi:hypothetical protein
MIISPLDPVSLSHVAAPLGATSGNLWGWQPQVRAELTHKIGSASTLFQIGVLRPSLRMPGWKLFRPPAALLITPRRVW